uniref:Uncharacterized protein n=1 Tax=Pararge aegeria TaxID=116150 RepID=S4P7P2_9NEOP
MFQLNTNGKYRYSHYPQPINLAFCLIGDRDSEIEPPRCFIAGWWALMNISHISGHNNLDDSTRGAQRTKLKLFRQ